MSFRMPASYVYKHNGVIAGQACAPSVTAGAIRWNVQHLGARLYRMLEKALFEENILKKGNKKRADI